MCKRIGCVVLCLVLLMGMALPVFAQEAAAQLSISTAEELLAFAENCRLDSYSQNLTVCLERDIDLGEISFGSIPVFSGSFDGKGHTISGLSITEGGSVRGIFRYLTATAVVQNLTVKGNIHPGGSRNKVGAIAGENAGQILNCSFTGQLSGADYAGGIVGVNTVTGIIENCQVNGELYAAHFVGGIAGENAGVIRNCSNSAKINTTPQQNDVEISDITIDTLTNTEAANTVTDIGGIAGISSGVLRDCQNFGDVGYRNIGYNIGGIAGTQSGYVTGCENHGAIQGRKEVGGIVGQMEPASAVTYSEDTLQILQGQLGELSGYVNQAYGNAQANGGQISSQIGILQEQTQTAQGAVDALLPDRSNPELPDTDTTLAALNTLSASLNAIPGTLRSITAAAQTTVGDFGRDIHTIAGAISQMEDTLNGASENLGGTLTDVSDQDTPDMLTGKVELCNNCGSVFGDINVGGIAGAVAVENDFDVLEDWESYGEESLNFQSQMRAVILQCENRGIITGKKQNAGGIVGWQALGLVKYSINTGKTDCADAAYVGGISGLSTGYLRNNYVKCEIAASAHAGGIAGSGIIATDCLAQVTFAQCSEYVGAILGTVGKSGSENEISGNYYLNVDRDFGAIDGISYSGVAEPMTLDSFLCAEGLPDSFKTVTVRFLFENGETSEIAVQPGESLDKTQIPELPKKAGYTGKWEGLENTKLENILFDMSFKAVYTSCNRVIESEQTRENGLPMLLLQGSFTEQTTVQLKESDLAPSLAKNEMLLECWQISSDEKGDTARFLLPADTDAGHVKLLLCHADGQWAEVSFTRSESYLVFSLPSGVQHLALVRVHTNDMIWVIAGITIAALSILSAVLVYRRKRQKNTGAADKTNSTL